VQYARLLAAEGFDEIQVRVARLAGNFAKVVAFYGATLGLPVIGFFEDHDGHDGAAGELWSEHIGPRRHDDVDDRLPSRPRDQPERLEAFQRPLECCRLSS
jgi:hypothetical protein